MIASNWHTDSSNADKIEMFSFFSKAINHCCWSFTTSCSVLSFHISQKCQAGLTPRFPNPLSADVTNRQTDRHKKVSLDRSPSLTVWFGENLYGFSIVQHNSEDFYFQLHIHIWSNPSQFLYSACYSTSHLHSEMFERQKAFFFISLNRVAFIHNGRFQIIELIKGFVLKERTMLYYTVLSLNLVDRIFLTD